MRNGLDQICEFMRPARQDQQHFAVVHLSLWSKNQEIFTAILIPEIDGF